MATNSVKFDWSILDRQGLINFVKLISAQVVNKELTVSKIHRIFATHIKKHLPVKITKQTDTKVDFGYIYVGGSYISEEDRKRKKCIELCFVYHPGDTVFCLTNRKFNAMAQIIADTILHEIIHMRQFRRRNFKYLPDYASTAEKTEQRKEQSYLGCSDEIDAYSFNIACELLTKFKNNTKQISKYLNQTKKSKSKRENWIMYMRAFDYNHNHPIIKRVKTKVIRYLPRAEVGKPYRNNDWIWR
jgi:hypothetical protein